MKNNPMKKGIIWKQMKPISRKSAKNNIMFDIVLLSIMWTSLILLLILEIRANPKLTTNEMSAILLGLIPSFIILDGTHIYCQIYREQTKGA